MSEPAPAERPGNYRSALELLDNAADAAESLIESGIMGSAEIAAYSLQVAQVHALLAVADAIGEWCT